MEKEPMCPLEYGPELFGGKWKPKILCVLSTGEAMRYSTIRRALGNITDAVLAAMLKKLAQDGLILKTQFNEIPPRVEYGLTDKGTSILPIFQEICAWSRMQSAETPERKLPACKHCKQMAL